MAEAAQNTEIIEDTEDKGSELKDIVAEAWDEEEKSIEAKSGELKETEERKKDEEIINVKDTKNDDKDDERKLVGKRDVNNDTSEKDTKESLLPKLEKTKKDVSEIKPPIAYDLESREAWKDVPASVKQQIHAREVHMAEAMRDTAQYRKTHESLNKLTESYASIMAAEGTNDPMEAISGLFQTVAELRIGTPQQVATKMANLIDHYGVDISMLDSALAGQPVQSTEMNQMERMLEDKLRPFQDMVSHQNTTQKAVQDKIKSDVDSELKDFSDKAEYLDIVRNDMADLIDMASKRNRKVGFQEAYDKACAMHPEISSILNKRTENEKLKNSGESFKNKSNAASSLNSRSGAVASGGEKTLREEIVQAWDDQTQ